MSHLDFLSPDLAAADAVWRSPLERALAHAHAGFEDLSRTGVLEVRGELNGLEVGDAEVVRLTPERALVLCPFEDLMRRLTDLDLDALPAVGPLAHVQALVLRDTGEIFRLYFAQEYGHSVAEAVIDAAEGLGR
jgi:hypothetical protein